ncbi:hypothetical protein BKA62DRAFT_96647 [Auriculariales sp. MPI-PUGE-AT-0066]|nr:hypothetical protein BKA62DRAFT_96647 [Auriculariales sp. MPI-PUGE-AT-0066]
MGLGSHTRDVEGHDTNLASRYIAILLVAGQQFEVPRSRLEKFCPSLASSLDQSPRIIELDHNIDDWTSFLWYTELDPEAILEVKKSSDSEAKCRRLVGAAVINFLYENDEDARWLLNWAYEMLETDARTWTPGADLLVALTRAVPDMHDGPDEYGVTLHGRSRDIWCDALADPTTDPIALVAALDDSPLLLALAYFYTLRLSDDIIAGDSRLTGLDRRRLMLGMWSLREEGILRSAPWPEPCRRSPQPYIRQGDIYLVDRWGRCHLKKYYPPRPWQPRVDPRVGDGFSNDYNLWARFSTGPWSLED